MYSTGSHWRISHTLLSEGELFLSGAGFEGWLEIKIGLLHRCFPLNSQTEKATLLASVAACRFAVTNQAL